MAKTFKHLSCAERPSLRFKAKNTLQNGDVERIELEGPGHKGDPPEPAATRQPPSSSRWGCLPKNQASSASGLLCWSNMDFRHRVMIQAIVFVVLLGVPGNLVTLNIYWRLDEAERLNESLANQLMPKVDEPCFRPQILSKFSEAAASEPLHLNETVSSPHSGLNFYTM